LAILDRNQYEKYSGELKKLLNSPVIAKSSHSADLQELLNGLLNWECDKRLTVDEVLSSRWMNDSTLITVKYLDKINNYENKQQL
jgi:serine/threonine protein kinase